jgi:hypothetical protein
MSAEDEVHAALSDALARLTGNSRFTVVEFGAAGATIVRVYRDENGTPRPEEPRAEVRASALRDADTFYRELDPAFIVRTSDALPGELPRLLPAPDDSQVTVGRPFRRGVPVFRCDTPLKELVKTAIRVSPLVLGYELAVLAPLPDGRLGLSSRPLFPVGAETGHEVRFQVRCAATDATGTAFAVVTREPRPDIPPRDRELQPVQLQSVTVAPGTYQVTARLDRPGRVTFHGVPGLPDLPPASRGTLRAAWDARRRSIPDRLVSADPVHLVCLVEVSGGEERLRGRVEWLAKLIGEAESGARTLSVSVLGYGPHSVSWAVDEEPYRLLAWEAPGPVAEQALRGLVDRVADEREYLEAAQLECALEGIARHLPEAQGRPVLVTAGGRPPHPPGMDTDTGIIPCPDRVAWAPQVERISALGATFGALHDQRSRGAAWQALGRDAAAATGDAVDLVDFAARLGLRESDRSAPLPFTD